jgi:tetratricopeptide (TPR) repeat protein
MTKAPDLLDIDHPDFAGLLGSIESALSPPFEAGNLALGFGAVHQLRTPLWRKGYFNLFRQLVAQGIRAAEATGLKDEQLQLSILAAGLHEAIGEWKIVLDIATRIRARGVEVGLEELAIYEGAAAHNLGHYARARAILAAAEARAPRDSRLRLRLAHKLHRTLLVLGERSRGERLLDDVMAQLPTTDRWFRAELLLDKASILRARCPADALDLARDARRIYVDEGFRRGIAFAELEIGRCLVALEAASEALAPLAESRRLFDELRYEPGRAHVRIAQGDLRLALGNTAAATMLFDEAAAIGILANYPAVVLRARTRALRSAFMSGSFVDLFGELARLGAVSTLLLKGSIIRRWGKPRS